MNNSSPSPVGLFSPVVLCIDDRPEVLRVRKSKLESLGYFVIMASNASGAIAVLARMTVAAVLVEYKMEGMDAEAVALQIKRRFPHQPVVLLSAYSDMPERILWLVDQYVLRSVSLEELGDVIASVSRPAKKPGSSFAQVPMWRQASA